MPISIAVGAVAAAAALTLATGQPSAGHAGNLVTTAVIRQMASATKAALATSGKVRVTGRSHGLVEVVDKKGHHHHPVEITGGTYSFSGKDYNQTMYIKVPGQPPFPGVSVVRFVHGQEYFFATGFGCAPTHPHCDTSKPRWYHMVGRLTRFQGLADPRGILKVLAPSAKFVSEGTQTINGVRTTKLKATSLTALSGDSLPGITSKDEKLTGLTVWVDRHGVVRQIHLSGRDGQIAAHKGAPVTYPRRLRFTSTIDFLEIGVRQHIKAPAHAIRYVSK